MKLNLWLCRVGRHGVDGKGSIDVIDMANETNFFLIFEEKGATEDEMVGWHH